MNSEGADFKAQVNTIKPDLLDIPLSQSERRQRSMRDDGGGPNFKDQVREAGPHSPQAGDNRHAPAPASLSASRGCSRNFKNRVGAQAVAGPGISHVNRDGSTSSQQFQEMMPADLVEQPEVYLVNASVVQPTSQHSQPPPILIAQARPVVLLSRKGISVLLLAVVVGTVMIAITLILTRQKSPNQSAPGPQPTQAPTMAQTKNRLESPTQKPTAMMLTQGPTSGPMPDRSGAIVTYITNITLSASEVRYPPSDDRGAEELALQWLIEDDPLQVPETNLLKLRQRYALATLYFETRGDSWTTSTGWLVTNECDWFGITCIREVVSEINLVLNANTGNNLQGTIPDDIGLLQSLTVLDLSDNSVSGTIPEGIAQLSSLTLLNLDYSSIGGTFPDAMGTSLSNLEFLYFEENGLSGALPSSFGNMTSLIEFKVWNTGLTGLLPASIAQWTRLEYFGIYGNGFTGTLPDLGHWKSLTHFAAQNNAFTGTIPESVVGWRNIQIAHFEGNAFIGNMPDGLCNVPSLTFLGADCAEVNCTCCSCSENP